MQEPVLATMRQSSCLDSSFNRRQQGSRGQGNTSTPLASHRNIVDQSTVRRPTPLVPHIESVRHMEPQLSGTSAGGEAQSFNLSPLTEANRTIALSVAESALMGDDVDDGIDIDQRIRMLERRVTSGTCFVL